MRHAASGTPLLVRREAENWVGNDFTRPTGAVGRTDFGVSMGRSASVARSPAAPIETLKRQLGAL